MPAIASLTRRSPDPDEALEGGFVNLRMLLGLTLALSGIALAIFAGKEAAVPRASEPERYMPVPGGKSESEAAGLAQLEQYWHDRLTLSYGPLRSRDGCELPRINMHG